MGSDLTTTRASLDEILEAARAAGLHVTREGMAAALAHMERQQEEETGQHRLIVG